MIISIPRASKPAFGVPLDPGHSLCAGLAYSWPLNDGGGTSADNVVGGVGAGPALSFNGACKWVVDVGGLGVSLSGSPYLGTGTLPNYVEPLTLEALFSLPSLPSTAGTVICLGSGTQEYAISANGPGGGSHLGLVVGGAAVVSTTVPPVGQLLHVAAVFVSTGLRYLYLNGQPIITDTVSRTTTVSSPVLRLGLRTGTTQALVGTVYGGNLYSRALTAAEVAARAANYWHTFEPHYAWSPDLPAAAAQASWPLFFGAVA